MECLNCKDYVRIEAKPIVTDIIKNWIDSERPVDWFECLEDVEEFEDLELPEELNATIVSEINQSVKDCLEYYEYDETTVNVENLNILIEDIWCKEKTKYTEQLYDLFDREDFDVDDYYDGEFSDDFQNYF